MKESTKRTEVVPVRMRESEREKADERAKQEGISRSELIRRALDAYPPAR